MTPDPDKQTKAIAVMLLKRGELTPAGVKIAVDLPITHQRHAEHSEEVNCVIETFLDLQTGSLQKDNPFLYEIENDGERTLPNSDKKNLYLTLNVSGLEKIAGMKMKAVKNMPEAILAGYRRCLPVARLRA